jgi:hypothetical protein
MLAAALLATAVLAGHPAVPASVAPAPLCRGQLAPAPPDPDATIKLYMAERASYGFRSDEAYVRALIKRGVRAPNDGDIPVTAAEKRYLQLRNRLVLGAKADAYLKLHRDVYGGVSIGDDWPRGPYVLVRFTRDRTRYERALRPLVRYPHNLRTRLVPYSYQHLLDVQQRIDGDTAKLAKAGFSVEQTTLDTDTGVVDVALITRRNDAAAYFADRYGPVRTGVIATEPTSLACTPASSYEIAPDGLSLIVHWTTGGGAKTERIEVNEQPDRVSVGVVERVPNGVRPNSSGPEQEPVALSAPLGDRPVYDAATGKRLLQQGPSPGDPACPVAPTLSALDQAIQERLGEGLPAGRDYVRKRLRATNYYTPSEQRWLALVNKLQAQPRVDAYLREHAADYGGSTVAGSFPGTPYLLVHVTRRASQYEARLKRLTKLPVRTVTVARTRTQLDALASRISAAAAAAGGFFDGYGHAGFYFANASRDEATNGVDVAVITSRTDAQAYFQARYGPLVRVIVIGTRFECAPPT